MLSAKQIPAGKSGQIAVSVDTESVAGKLLKTVTITTNDPRQAQITLNMIGTVRPEFTLSERRFAFGNVRRGKEVTKEIVITLQREKSARLISAQSTDQSVRVRLEPVPGSQGKSVKLVGIQKGDAKPGYHSGVVVIKTSSNFKPELKIPISGMITE